MGALRQGAVSLGWRASCRRSGQRSQGLHVAVAAALGRRASSSVDERAQERAQDGQRRKAGESCLRVVTYNVLNPKLCSLLSHPHCDPDQLGEPLRLSRVLARLDGMIAGAAHPTVLCLQEVNESWACHLHSHFQRRGYHLMYAPTPQYAYDPMGVCLVWSNSAFELEAAEMRRVVEPAQTPVQAAPPSWWQRLKAYLAAAVAGPAYEQDPWVLAGRRPNRYAIARLRFRPSGHSVCIGTYHMPALFGSALNEQVMAVHAAAVGRLASRFAGQSPLVLAGDFNVQPGTRVHELLRGATTLEQILPGAPAAAEEEDPAPLVRQPQLLRSAYRECLGAEPEFTIRSWRADAESPFVGTLDYIFVGDGVGVRGVRALPPAAQFADDQVFPSAEEPSDHLPLLADLAVGGGGGGEDE